MRAGDRLGHGAERAIRLAVKGKAVLQVEVLEHGFAFEGKTYRSLSAVAKAVTGSHCSGHFFFGLTAKGAKS